MVGVDLAWARSSRRHRIGRAHARYVIDTTQPTSLTTVDGSQALLWVANDDRGLELEIVAVVLPDCHLVIHVMPTALREGKT